MKTENKTNLELINDCIGEFINPVSFRELENRKLTWVLNTKYPYHQTNVDYLSTNKYMQHNDKLLQSNSLLK